MSVWLLLVVSLGACTKFDDCKLYNTCTGDLIELAVEVSADAGAECDACLQRECKRADRDCSEDLACHYTARCHLSTSPLDWQECLTRLYKFGYSRGLEERFVWEGDEENAFSSCLEQKCTACVNARQRWGCDVAPLHYNRILGKLSIRRLSFTEQVRRRPAVGVQYEASACSGSTADKPRCSTPTPRQANELGMVDLSFGDMEPAQLYFELSGCHKQPMQPGRCEAPSLDDRDAIPPTLFYPGPLAEEKEQPVAVYVISRADVAEANRRLNWGNRVLGDTSQSLILPDSCIWERNAAPSVRIRVKDRPDLGLCTFRPDGQECVPGQCKPCIWYAREQAPLIGADHTDDSGGAGVIGLPPGVYTVEVVDMKTSNVVGRRSIQMRAGYLTIARIWPNGDGTSN